MARDPVKKDPTRKNVVLLALCQALGMSCSALVITVIALVGNDLAPERSLITLPLALQFLAMMASTAPASFFMRRFGRRAGFSLGALLGCAAGLLGMQAILIGSFYLLCLSSMLFGAFTCHVQYYRFAAADTASDAFRSRAISLVLAGGLLAAVLGPELAKWSRDLFAPVLFAGAYLCIAGLAFLSLILVQFIKIPRPGTAERSGNGRPLGVILRQPSFIVAVCCAMVGYGAMNLVMTATPLAMVAHSHPFDTAALVIQWHIVGMYAPSFFTGHLIHRFGVVPVLGLGGLLIAACVCTNLVGEGVFNFWAALILLGLGWNFMFVGGSALLTESYRPAEKAKVQAVNEFMVFATVSCTALLSGALFNLLGWRAVNLAVLAPTMVAFGAVLWLSRQRAAVVA
ncbi:MAG: MFS transporter [Rhodospirillales bacterium]|nr:MFS transporter [Rhodospirillales bacterium]